MTTTAVLAAVVITQEHIAAAKLHGVCGNAVVVQQADDAGDLNNEVDRPDPVFVGRTIVNRITKLANFAPRVEIVGHVGAVFDVDNLRDLLTKEAECSSSRDNMHWHIHAVQDENTRVQR